MGHNLSALWACESGGEKHSADGDRLKLALMGTRLGSATVYETGHQKFAKPKVAMCNL